MMTHIMKNDSMKNPAVVETVETQRDATFCVSTKQPTEQPTSK